MQIEIWTLPDCPRCEAVKRSLQAKGHEVMARSLEELRRGREPDVEAMVACVMSDGVAPLVRSDGRMLDRTEIEALVAEGMA